MYRAGDTRKGKAGRQQKIMRVVEHLATVPMLPPTKKKRNPYVKGMMDAAKIIMKCTVPNVGDIVRFNDEGLEQVFGSARGKSFMKKLELRITKVDAESITYPEATFVVEVDDPEINQFLIDHRCFDIVRRA
jgi:signal peptidase I